MGGQYRDRLHRENRNGEWISTIPHHLNVVGLSWEELWDNPCLIYVLMTQDIPATCDGYSKKVLIKNDIS